MPSKGFCAELTRCRFKNDNFFTAVERQAAIHRFSKEYNTNDAKPSIWRTDPDKIDRSQKSRVPNGRINPLTGKRVVTRPFVKHQYQVVIRMMWIDF